DDLAGDLLVALEFDRHRLALGVTAVDMRHDSAGRDVADKAELAPGAADQRADAQNRQVSRIVAPLAGPCRRLLRKGEKGLLMAIVHKHPVPAPLAAAKPHSVPPCANTIGREA